LGVSESAIRNWKKQLGSGNDNKKPQSRCGNKAIKKENERLRMEREILKKAAAFFARENL